MLVGQVLLVPSPSLVMATLFGLVRTAQFWQIAGWSLLRIGLGFVGGVLAGAVAAALTHRFRVADALLSPALRVVRAAPVASFVILALVWIPTGRLPVFIAFLMVVPVVWDNVGQGLRQLDPLLLEMASVFHLTWWQAVRRITLPSLVPFLTSACTAGMGLAWKAGVAAEVISRPSLSIGRELQDARVYLDTPEVFAWTITVVALSLVLEWLLRLLAARWNRRFIGPEAGRAAEPAGRSGPGGGRDADL